MTPDYEGDYRGPAAGRRFSTGIVPVRKVEHLYDWHDACRRPVKPEKKRYSFEEALIDDAGYIDFSKPQMPPDVPAPRREVPRWQRVKDAVAKAWAKWRAGR